MNFILVYPPTYNRVAEIPVGGLFLAESLRRHSYSVSLVNDVGIDEIREAVRRLVDEATIAIGLSVVSALVYKDTIKISRLLKEDFPHLPIIWGGQAICGHEEVILAFGAVDYIVVGDGEDALPTLLTCLKNKESPEGIVGVGYRRDGAIHLNGSAIAQPLDRKILLPYDLLDISSYYRKLNIGGDRWLGAIYSRGCPYNCSFCINSTAGNINAHMRYHSAEHIIADMTELSRHYGADAITIHDDHFLLNEKRINAFCDALEVSGLKLRFRANARVDSICRLKSETLVRLRSLGFVNIIAGIESGSPRMLGLMNKRITLEQIKQADDRLSSFGFYKHWNFLTALPGETLEDVAQTLWLIAQLGKTAVDSPFPFSFRKFIPLPGTKMFQSAVTDYGLKEPKDIEAWSAFSEAFLREVRVGDLEPHMRPWLTPELGEYVQRGEDCVSQLNGIYTGPDSDKQLIAERIEELEKLALSVLSERLAYPRERTLPPIMAP